MSGELSKSDINRGMGHALDFRGLGASVEADRLNRILLISDIANERSWEEPDATKVLFINLQATAIVDAKPSTKDGLYTYIAVDWDPRLFQVKETFAEYFAPWLADYECWEWMAKQVAGDAWPNDPVVAFKARTSYLTIRGYNLMRSRFDQWAGPIIGRYKHILGLSGSSEDGIRAAKQAKESGGVKVRE